MEAMRVPLDRPRKLLTLGTAAVLAAGLALPASSVPLDRNPAPARAAAQPVYLQSHRPVPDRVADLLRRMTLEEKVGQMTQIAALRIMGDCEWSGGDLNPACMKAVLADAKVGSILSGGGNPPGPQSDLGAENTPRLWAEMVNAIQRFALANSRLRIPIIYGVDAVHGHNNVLNATLFPHQLGLAATWDPALARQVGASAGRAVKATGITWNFAPVSDLARDARWGRYYETFGEDPVLAGSLAANSAAGIETGGRVAATMKHFAGYSQPLNGHDRVPAELPMRYLQDTLLPPYKAQVDAGVDTVMVNSGAVNGIPAHASRYLLTDVLRRQWRFTGVVVSDWEDVRALQTKYRIAADYPAAIAIAVNAGVDMAMEPYNAAEFTAGLLRVARDGRVPRARVDEAVGRILALKFKLGLFENPYVDPARADAAVLGADRPLARRAAVTSLTLLRNERAGAAPALPLPAGRRIVVAGPNADNLQAQLGGWSIGWQGVPDNVVGKITDGTILDALRSNAPAGTTVVPARTEAEAVARTRTADAAVLVVGEGAGAEGLNDKEVPALEAAQQRLVDAVQATGKPVVVVVVASRPLVLGAAADASALLMAYQPGSEGGNAVADVLYGRANPSGRLPMSWPKTVGDQPMFYQQLPGTNGGPSSGYDPLYPFGAGLSYTTYETRAVQLGSAQVGPRDQVTVRVRVANTGQRAGEMVVPVYVGQPVSRVLTPPKRLVAFTRVGLRPGEERTVTVTFPVRLLAVTPGDVNGAGPQRVEPGAYQVSSADRTAPLTVR
jgi:beta-glucosidase